MASAFGTTYRFREPGTPGRVARWACLLSAAILSITGIVAIARGASDAEWQVRLFLPAEGSSAQPAFSTFYPGAIGTVVWVGSLAFLATAVCWLVWQARAHENVWAVPGLPAPTRTPGMAVIWWFIPFANLVMPYVCVRELATISAARAGSTPRRGLPGVWWALFLAAVGRERGRGRLAVGADRRSGGGRRRRGPRHHVRRRSLAGRVGDRCLAPLPCGRGARRSDGRR